MMAVKQIQVNALMRDVLGDEYLTLELRCPVIEEDLELGRATVAATLLDSRGGAARIIRGEGPDLARAAFGAVMGAFVGEFPSLTGLRFRSLAHDEAPGFGSGPSASDSQVTAHLAVDNAAGNTFRFEASSGSAAGACLQVSLTAIEYFFNSERAYFRVRMFLDEAKAKARPDLIGRYTWMLAQLVQNSTYTAQRDMS
jgi:hypothetical protein